MTGFVLAPLLAIHFGSVLAVSLALFGGFYILTALGVEVGFHRLFSHRSFKSKAAGRLILGIFGSMAGEGSLSFWVSIHRDHHRFVDREGDPHSPHPGSIAAIWHAHVGWLFAADQATKPGDFKWDATARLIDRTYLVWFVLGLVLPAIVGMVAGGERGALEGFVWGGLLRVAVCHQFTWCLNSLAHLVGTRPYRTHDDSRNVWFLALPTVGGAWHNNHHAMPGCATNDHRWWQIDPSAWVIRGGNRLGLFSDLNRPQDRSKLLPLPSILR